MYRIAIIRNAKVESNLWRYVFIGFVELINIQNNEPPALQCMLEKPTYTQYRTIPDTIDKVSETRHKTEKYTEYLQLATNFFNRLQLVQPYFSSCKCQLVLSCHLRFIFFVCTYVSQILHFEHDSFLDLWKISIFHAHIHFQ